MTKKDFTAWCESIRAQINDEATATSEVGQLLALKDIAEALLLVATVLFEAKK